MASYFSIRKEVDLSCLINQHESIYLPVIQAHFLMQFKLLESINSLKANKYGILEPQDTKLITADEIEICFLPLVGFNRKGYRLGMGGGYYDRYFELNKFKRKPTKLIGIAYDFQESDTIQPQTWDIPLDIIITNNEIIEP